MSQNQKTAECHPDCIRKDDPEHLGACLVVQKVAAILRSRS